MKNLGFLLLLILAVGCSPRSESNQLHTIKTNQERPAITPQSRFEIGDVAHLKPDSLQVVIEQKWTYGRKGNTTYHYSYYYHVTTAEEGTFRRSGRKAEIFFY